MTAQELLNRPMELVSHCSCRTKHISYYRIRDTNVWVEHSVRFHNGEPVGKTKEQYSYGGRRYKSLQQLIQAINNNNNNNNTNSNE